MHPLVLCLFVCLFFFLLSFSCGCLLLISVVTVRTRCVGLRFDLGLDF